MANRFELAQYLANLTEIFEFHERLGTIKNPAFMEDFNRHHRMLVEEISGRSALHPGDTVSAQGQENSDE